MRFTCMFLQTKSSGYSGRSFGVSIVFLCGLAGLFPIAADAAEKIAERGRQTITIAYSSISGNMAPLWITYERGFFRKYGLDA
jgi:ABC-type nitrate/sulfonate/bicarbonate transport system substrate-binding protein